MLGRRKDRDQNMATGKVGARDRAGPRVGRALRREHRVRASWRVGQEQG